MKRGNRHLAVTPVVGVGVLEDVTHPAEHVQLLLEGGPLEGTQVGRAHFVGFPVVETELEVGKGGVQFHFAPGGVGSAPHSLPAHIIDDDIGQFAGHGIDEVGPQVEGTQTILTLDDVDHSLTELKGGTLAVDRNLEVLEPVVGFGEGHGR